MEQLQKAYSIFCDESCYLQFDNSDIMCIGAIIVPNADLDTLEHINPNFALITGFCVDQSNHAYYMRKLHNKA